MKLLSSPDDFVLFGLASPEKDYRISWFINKYLKLDLQKLDDLIVDNPRDSVKLYFSKFCHEDEENRRTYFLLRNKYQSGNLIPEWKNMDYIFKVNGNIEEEEKINLLENLKLIPSVQIAVEIDSNALKTIENLIFE